MHPLSPSASARLPGSTVALFSTLQPLFTGMLGLIGITFVASALRLVALPRTPCLLSHGHTVLGEGVSLQSGLGGAAIVLGKLLLLSQVKLSPPPQPLLTLTQASSSAATNHYPPPPP